MEVQPGVHRIEVPIATRFAAVYVITGSDGALVIDTAFADSVDGVILPYLDEIGLLRETVTWVAITHADFDHSGGAAALKQALPAARVLAGREDIAQLEDTELMIADRYGEFAEHGFDESDEAKEFIRAVAPGVNVDLGVAGGEVIDLGGRRVEVLHAPGHSDGHIAFWLPEESALFAGDAVLGRSVLHADGTPAFPSTYRNVSKYISTIEAFIALQPATLYTAHFPIYAGAAAMGFLTDSISYAEELEAAVEARLDSDGQSLLGIIDKVHVDAGPWEDAAAYNYLAYPVLGHLERLEMRGVATREETKSGSVTWRHS